MMKYFQIAVNALRTYLGWNDTAEQSVNNESVNIQPSIPDMLIQLGWEKVAMGDQIRWRDPNAPDITPSTTEYAWYVSKLRVSNRTDTRTLRLTNADLAQLVK